jgi:hypothetical protein
MVLFFVKIANYKGVDMEDTKKCCDRGHHYLSLVNEMQNVEVKCDDCGIQFVTGIDRYETAILNKYKDEIRAFILGSLNTYVQNILPLELMNNQVQLGDAERKILLENLWELYE